MQNERELLFITVTFITNIDWITARELIETQFGGDPKFWSRCQSAATLVPVVNLNYDNRTSQYGTYAIILRKLCNVSMDLKENIYSNDSIIINISHTARSVVIRAKLIVRRTEFIPGFCRQVRIVFEL